MIRMEYPSVNLDDYSGDAKVYALQSQVNSLANALQIVLDSLEDDGNGFTEDIDKVSGKTSELKTLIESKVSASVDNGSGTKSSVPSGASNLTNLTEVSLDEEGIYLLLGRVRFASNTSGRRGAAWASNSTGYFYHSLVVGAPANGGATLMQTMAIIEVTSNTAPYTAYLNCYHTAGASNPLDIEYYWRYLKLA